MKRIIAALALGLFVGLTAPALADHINEPTNPITDLNLHLENYSTNTPVDCTGVQAFPYAKVRVAMYINSVGQAQGNPSEHFRAGFITLFEVADSRGIRAWRQDNDPQWSHQNVPPHVAGVFKFDASRLTDISVFPRLQAGVTSTGWWKVQATVTGDESGTVLTEECLFRVAL